jgi:hypothetical protein
MTRRAYSELNAPYWGLTRLVARASAVYSAHTDRSVATVQHSPLLCKHGNSLAHQYSVSSDVAPTHRPGSPHIRFGWHHAGVDSEPSVTL